MAGSVFVNKPARDWVFSPATAAKDSTSSVLAFHKTLPGYNQTRLHSLPDVARSLGIGHVLVKDESDRFGLPSFKILGASWAVYRAVCAKIGLDPAGHAGPSLEELGRAAREFPGGVRIVTATEGNWGRAVGRMASYLGGIETTIYVPGSMIEVTRGKIRGEGAVVVPVEGGEYDDCLEEARRCERETGALLVVDTAWDDQAQIPQWVVEGYSTMLAETDHQVTEATGGQQATHAFVPVGVGSIAQAVTQHYKSASPENPSPGASRAVVSSVEPTTAAGLQASLRAGSPTTVSTGDTIMCGMNCGNVSATAWPVLRGGVDAAITVTDWEADAAVRELARKGVMSGPCGAATFAALRRAVELAKGQLGFGEGSVVVLFSTEGTREYHFDGKAS